MGVVEMEDAQKEEREELDGLTMEELRSLLQNFQNLSRQEQTDMIAYMRRLEGRDPDKVRRLKLGLPQWGGGESRIGLTGEMGEESNGRNGEGGGANQQREDWSPINKRRRRLSGSDLDINPDRPVSREQHHGAQGQQGGGGEHQWGDDGEWEGVGEQPQEREPQWPRGPSWEDQLASTWSGRREEFQQGRRGGARPESQQGRPYQHGWPRPNM